VPRHRITEIAWDRLSYATGVALGLRLGEFRVARGVPPGRWRATDRLGRVAAHLQLDNLIAVVDYNKVMAKETADLMSVEPLPEKVAAFGWSAMVSDFAEIFAAFHRANTRDARPAGLHRGAHSERA
jgi:hypothetical protein